MFRLAILLILLIIITYPTIGLRNLKIDNSLQVLFPKDDPSYVRYKDFLHSFGNDEVGVTLITDSIPISDLARLETNDELCTKIELIADLILLPAVAYYDIIKKRLKNV